MNTVTVSALSPSISHSAIFWNTLIHISLEIFTQCNAGKKKCGSFWKFREVFLLKIAPQLNTGREETKNGGHCAWRGYPGQKHVQEAQHVLGNRNSFYYQSTECNMAMRGCKNAEVTERALYFKLTPWTLGNGTPLKYFNHRYDMLHFRFKISKMLYKQNSINANGIDESVSQHTDPQAT